MEFLVEVTVSGWERCRLPASVMIQSEGLSGADLVAAFVERRISPLQSRPHMMCQMSGRFDPSRLSTREMPHAEVSLMVNYMSNCKLAEDWRYGKAPYSRPNPPPVVSFPLFLLFVGSGFMMAGF